VQPLAGIEPLRGDVTGFVISSILPAVACDDLMPTPEGRQSLIKLCFVSRTVRKPVEVTRKYRLALPPLSVVASPRFEQTKRFFWSHSSVA
jgi:hypothetical protein